MGPGEFKDRYILNKYRGALKSGLIGNEALEVIEEYHKLFKDTLKYRKEFNQRYPEYQVINWDASFYQLKWLFKDYSNERFKQFQLNKP